jgi:DnaK suppressor protein
MNTTDIKRFESILTARIAELEKLTRSRDGISIERSADQLDEIQGASERALAVGNLDRQSAQLRNARAALRRVPQGSYGICHDCEEDIHPRRLAALPWALYCIKCQEARDRRDEYRGRDANFLASAA